MAYEIPIDSAPFETLVKAIDAASSAVDRLDDKVRGLNGGIGQTRTLGGRVVAAAANPADSALGQRNPFPGERDFIGPERGAKTRPFFEGETSFIGPPRPEEPYSVRGGRSASLDPYDYEGPHQRLQRERSMLNRARETGDEALTRDWETRVERSQRQVERLDGSRGFGSAVQNALMRSRLNLGPLSPLVMDLVGDVGGAGSAALGAAGLGLGAIQASYARSQRDSSAFYAMGGSASNVGAALALGGENAEAKALQLGDRLREGTVGAGFLRSQGIQYRGRYTDYSGNYVQAIDALGKIPDVQERIRTAREVGLGDDVWLADVDKTLRDQLMRSRGVAGSDSERKATANQRAERETSQNWWMNQLSAIGGALYDTFFNVANPWGMNSAPPEKKPDNKRPTARGWERGAERPMSNGPETLNGTLVGAIPAGWRGKLLNDVLDNQGIMVGGFSI
jgi:hypothetical protein